MIDLFKFAAANQGQLGVVVVNCGVRHVWELVLKQSGYRVPVIGGVRLADGYVVTPEVKRDLVCHSKEHHKLTVCAFGDSALDIEMLLAADHAVVVTGRHESNCVEKDLTEAVEQRGLMAHQVLLPHTEEPGLDVEALPTMKPDEPSFRKLLDRQIAMHDLSVSDTSASKYWQRLPGI